MKPISFCINTAKNERNYITLLLQSLLNGIDIDLHEIIVFIDSDNQDTLSFLIDQQLIFPNLKIIKNNGNPIGYASNINYMFRIAKNEIVSYTQSDMIVSLNYDHCLLSHLADNMVLCSTRIEPPIHAQYDNAITYVRNFGLTPEDFDYEGFLKYTETIKNPTKLTNYFFAPFTCYKHVWNDIGGNDVSFLKSREDSDVAFRFCLNKTKLIQAWDVLVYHFTCTSSRSWALPENRNKNINHENDKIELERFIKKWGTFCHPSSYEQIEPYLLQNPPIINNIHVNNPKIDDSCFTIY